MVRSVHYSLRVGDGVCIVSLCGGVSSCAVVTGWVGGWWYIVCEQSKYTSHFIVMCVCEQSKYTSHFILCVCVCVCIVLRSPSHFILCVCVCVCVYSSQVIPDGSCRVERVSPLLKLTSM